MDTTHTTCIHLQNTHTNIHAYTVTYIHPYISILYIHTYYIHKYTYIYIHTGREVYARGLKCSKYTQTPGKKTKVPASKRTERLFIAMRPRDLVRCNNVRGMSPRGKEVC